MPERSDIDVDALGSLAGAGGEPAGRRLTRKERRAAKRQAKADAREAKRQAKARSKEYTSIKRQLKDLNALAKLQLLRSHVVDPDLSDIIIHTPRCLVNMETAAQGGCDLDMESREARDACGSLTQGRDGYDRFREADAR